jgi:HSP20 family protein
VENLFPSQWVTAFDTQALSINITEDDVSYHVDVNAPGFSKNEFKINIEDKILTISAGERYNDKALLRSFRLPENSNDAMISASYKNGILRLYIPKHEPAVKKEVPVQ